MSKSPVLGLELTGTTDNPRFKDWRAKLAGDTEDSNLMIVDGAVGELQQWNEEKNTSPMIWGKLKYGFAWKPAP